MRVIDADKMISDTLAMKKNIAEAIECDGIVKYLEEHSFDINTIEYSDVIIAKIKRQNDMKTTYAFANDIKQRLEECFPNSKVIITLDAVEIETANKE